MRVNKNSSFAYLQALHDVLFKPQYTPSPRGQKTREILDYTFKITKPTVDFITTADLNRNNVIESYSTKEFELYDSCTNKVEDFAKASKFWNHLKNPDGTVNSAYGYLIWKNKSAGNEYELQNVVKNTYRDEDLGIIDGGEAYCQRLESQQNYKRTPWEWAKQSLLADKDTRQAILRFSLPEHQWMGNKDQTCTLHGNFQIRENELHLSVTMRSNDLMKGLVYDLPWFISLMYKMRDELKDQYPGLKIGHYTHTSHSMHIYDRDIPAVLQMLGYYKKDETDASIKSGNIAISNSKYEDLMSGTIPGIFITDRLGTHVITNRTARVVPIKGAVSYVVLDYSSCARL
tara:strand:+ start:11504 stop:12538 length:1035 start_codon:yes stop_codon:yes gene_type:complete